MKPDTIFFDKDGTLMKFDPFWISVSRHAIREVLCQFGMNDNAVEDTEAILALLGVADEKTDVNAVLSKGTYAEIAEIIHKFLAKKGCKAEPEKMEKAVINAYNSNTDKGTVAPTCDNIREVLAELKDRGINLCVVTTDNTKITLECLKKLNILDMFQYIYTDDGKTAPKPNPECIFEYCNATGVEKDKIVMVGDTATDIRFARNAGISVICVGSEENLEVLREYADAAVADISHVSKVIEVL